MRRCEARKATLCPSIRAMKLSPCFLQQTDPKLVISARGEGWLAILATWQELINNDRRLLPIQKESHHVYPSLVDLLSHKHGLDTLRKLCKRAQRSQKVTITELPLINVIRFNTIFKDIDRIENLTGAFPGQIVELPWVVNFCINLGIVE